MSDFPAEWQLTVVILRGGQRDPRGNPQPERKIPREAVLVGWRATSDPLDRSDQTSDYAVLYDQGGDGFRYVDSDRVEIPVNEIGPNGTWQVDGQPKAWPDGWEVPLRRA